MRVHTCLLIVLFMACVCSCRAKGTSSEESSENTLVSPAPFDADSAYAYVARQVEFGPRVPNTVAHSLAADWLSAELRRHGAEVIEQRADIPAFDGTVLKARNIFGQFNPDAPQRILLLAHYDCRPWADQDPDPAKHSQPVDGANDGASGVGVLLEIARQISDTGYKGGVDILFVDAEDWGTDGDDESWAMGARHFAQNPPVEGYAPEAAVLLDMVGAEGAVFPREYISQQSAPALLDRFYAAAHRAGLEESFPNRLGGAITDDHIELLKAGIPAIDIIDYRNGFAPTWHTADDNLRNISKASLQTVGQALSSFLGIEN